MSTRPLTPGWHGSEALTRHGSRVQDSRGAEALGGGEEQQKRAPDLRELSPLGEGAGREAGRAANGGTLAGVGLRAN